MILNARFPMSHPALARERHRSVRRPDARPKKQCEAAPGPRDPLPT